jgi:hypothetical protein
MSLMLVNPRKRGTRKPRSAAQRAATKRMVAANRSRSAAPAKRRKSPKRSSARRSNPIGLHRVKHHRKAKTSHRRRNPIGISTSGITGMLMNGLKGAGGAIIVNLASFYMPAAVSTGNVAYATRAALAILLGSVGGKVLGSNARIMAEGSLTVTIHDFVNSMAGSMLPGSQLHGMGGYLSGQQSLPNQGRVHVDSELAGMGEYIYR